MTKTSLGNSHIVTPSLGRPAATKRLEWRVIDIPRHLSRADARSLVAEQAEYGRWELARSQVLYGGARRVWLRRKVMRVQRTDVR